MKKLRNVLPLALATALPLVANAASSQTLKGLIGILAGYLNIALELLMGFAVVAFVFYIIKYFIVNSEGDHAEAARYLMWSIIGFFVILSMWGLVNILLNTFNLNSGAPSTWTSLGDIFPTR